MRGLPCLLVLASGCGDTAKFLGQVDGTSGAGPEIPPAPPATQVDILLVVDNSRSMADKQAVLALTVPDLVSRFVAPPCLAPDGQPAPTPAAPLESCPAGFARAFAPILDIHVGVITSSLGGHGADSCPASTATGCAKGNTSSNNDRGHLISRLDPCDSGVSAVTYQNTGFLAWDPAATKSPPGESDLYLLASTLHDMVVGAGQIGCGFEAPLESVYRFLVDPAPYQGIAVESNEAVRAGVDEALLQQRREFLRPGSLLAIMMLSDENDCSIKEYGEFFYAGLIKNGDGSEFHLPRARSVCADDPLDACCRSCGQPMDECPHDPGCEQGALDAMSDNINLRCFEQKRRFGIDFLYPTARYVNAFRRPTITPGSDTLEGESGVPNPVFSDLTGTGQIVRDPTLVFFTSIVGVPWQLIAKNPATLAGGFKSSAELSWDIILGNPSAFVPPTDAHMRESIDPRPGLPTSGSVDPIHGHEYAIPKRDDLQYACTFPLPEPRNCADEQFAVSGCDCDAVGAASDNPLCAPNPDDGGKHTLQTRAKAYPGLRQLEVMKGLGAQGVVASICPDELDDETSPAFGYRPAVAALIEAATARLQKEE